MKHSFERMVSIAAVVATSAIADETFNGIGIAITPAEKGAEVESVIPGTPAADSKLQKGDVIISVNGNSTYCKKMDVVQNLLRGEKNKPVEIVFINNGDTLETSIRREKLTVKNLNNEGFKRDDLESYASTIQSDKKLVAIMDQGNVLDNEATVKATKVDCIYIDKDVIKNPPPETQGKETEKIKVKGVDRNSISFELESAGEALVTVTNSSGVVVSSVRLPHAMKGINRISWDSSNAPADRYVVSVEHRGFTKGKSVLLK